MMSATEGRDVGGKRGGAGLLGKGSRERLKLLVAVQTSSKFFGGISLTRALCGGFKHGLLNGLDDRVRILASSPCLKSLWWGPGQLSVR